MGFIKTENLTHDYVRRDVNGDIVGKEQALKGVSVDIPKGSFVVVLGANGSGKSTFAKHLNALLNPTGGTVWVNGLDTKDDKNLWDIRKNAGMVFQNPDNQIVATVVEEDVAFGPENMGVPQQELQGRVDEALKKVGMYEYRLHSPNRLSGGQKQRVAVAGIMAMKPGCIILDEPTAMLDPSGRREVLDTVHQLNKEEGITVILITHYMEEVTDADYIYVMDHGNVAMEGKPVEIFSRVEELTALRLAVPCATKLAYLLRKEGFPIDITGVLKSEDFVRAYEKAVNVGAIGENVEKQNSAMTGETTENSQASVAKGVRIAENRAFSEEINQVHTITAENASTAVLELQNVCYTYSPNTTYEKKALQNVNFAVSKGEFIGLIGHTGSGKSTLIQHFNGLEKPTSGKVLYLGEDIHGEKYSKKALRGHVGLVFQYPEYQLFEATVLKDVCFGPNNLGLSKEEAVARAKEALTLVNIGEDMYESNPLELSGGQKRRVAIAGVLAMKPDVLVLDEPTAGLDPVGHEEILEEIDRIHTETGMTVVLVSHSMEDVAQYADRIAVMEKGQLVLFAPPKEVFCEKERLENAGLSVPHTMEIMLQLEKRGLISEHDAITPEEAVSVLLRGRGTHV